MNLVQRLEELTGIAAPAGHEDAMIRRMRAGFEEAGLSVTVDPLGNIIAPVRRPRPGYPHVLVFAHMDEVGFIVRKIEPEGFIRLQRVGGIPEKSTAGQRIVFLGRDGPVQGIIATKAHHITEATEKYQVVPVSNAFADVGASSREEVISLGIEVGTPATWFPHFYRKDDVVQSKALDNRVGCVTLLALAEAAHTLKGGAGLTLIASVQEEFSIRGVVPAVRAVQPDLFVCVDITIAHDTPDTSGVGEVALGGGPSLGLFSFHGRGTLNGLIPNPKLIRFLETVARDHDVPFQRQIFFGGFTDASYAQLVGSGIPGVDLGIPARYTHSPVETCSLRDLRGAIALIQAMLEEVPMNLDLARG